MAKLTGTEAKAFVRIRDSIDKAGSWELDTILTNEENKEIVIAVAEFIKGKEDDGTFSEAVLDDIRDLRDKKRMSKEEILEK